VITAQQFIEPARETGFDFWAGVPCSFLGPLIDYTGAADGLRYVGAANEGDAVALATGAALAGHRAVAMMQNSGLGNAVSPLTSLNQVFRIPLLLIISLRGEPGSADEPQHELMGRITLPLLDTMEIGWDWFPDRASEVGPVLQEAVSRMDTTARPFALVMKKGTVAPFPATPEAPRGAAELAAAPAPGAPAAARPRRQDVLLDVVAATPESETVLVASTGYCGRQLYAVQDRANHFYMVGSMGCAASLGLGLSLALPGKSVIVIDGDGAALMRMGNMATVGACAGDNFYHLLLDNHVHESTGGQATVSGRLDFPAIARACGYRSVTRAGARPDIARYLQTASPSMLYVETLPGVPGGLPRPSIRPFEVARRLVALLGTDPAWAAVEP